MRAVFLLLLALVPLLQRRLDRELGEFRAQDEALYLWSGDQVKRLAPGLEGLAADVYWLRTVQYFGGQRLFDAEKNFGLLGPLVGITVTLDPRMEIAYRYGAIFLAEPRPLGAGRPREAVALLERGTRTAPLNWRLRQDLGFLHFLFLHDPQTAFEILKEASELEGAPFWLKNVAADVLAKGGDRATARRVWSEIAKQSEGVMRVNALGQIKVLEALDEADLVASLVQRFSEQEGRRPTSLDELRRAGLLERPPLDAAGIPFEYDPEKGTVRVSTRSPLWRPGY